MFSLQLTPGCPPDILGQVQGQPSALCLSSNPKPRDPGNIFVQQILGRTWEITTLPGVERKACGYLNYWNYNDYVWNWRGVQWNDTTDYCKIGCMERKSCGNLRAGKPATPPGISKVARHLPSWLIFNETLVPCSLCHDHGYLCHRLHHYHIHHLCQCHFWHHHCHGCQPYQDIPKPQFSLSGASPGKKWESEHVGKLKLKKLG